MNDIRKKIEEWINIDRDSDIFVWKFTKEDLVDLMEGMDEEDIEKIMKNDPDVVIEQLRDWLINGEGYDDGRMMYIEELVLGRLLEE